jgi:EAL domain-containing protein (putative c-di-GMP-specific phosphodiesterase class I)
MPVGPKRGLARVLAVRSLPIDFLKIDGSFIADIDSDPQAHAIVGAIITMADALALEVVAEGVEREAQADSLRDLSCGLGQGYLFGRPIEM